MANAGPQQLASLSAHLEGLEAAVEELDADPGVGVSVRRIARSLETAAKSLGAMEIAAGAGAIQEASDSQLRQSARIFLRRVEELREADPPEDVHLLVVEDNRTVAAATAAYVSGAGRTIHHAYTAQEALSTLTDRDIDVVILDLILPDRDGRDLLVHMREQARTANVPVVVLSARGGSVARAECVAVGADDFIEKPAEPKALRTSVARLLRRAEYSPRAGRDSLTGLPNRVGTRDEFERLKAESERDGTPLSVLLLKLDTLASIIEEMGSDAGDGFLLEVAHAVDETLDLGGALGRWETGMLVAMLPGTDVTEAERLLHETVRVLSALDEVMRYGAADVDPTFSGGVAVVGDASLHEAISAAEKAMYAAAPPVGAPPVGAPPVGAPPVGAPPVGAPPVGIPARDPEPVERRVPLVLLVEDDRVTATLIHHRLERDGYEVRGYDNGQAAFAWASEESFDLAILDVKVPGMDGFELLERLRKIDRFAQLPIIMLTGMGSESDVIRGLELGADDYILKPFSPTELLARVRRLLHAQATGGEALAAARRAGST